MDGMVEENGSSDPLAPSPEPPQQVAISSVGITSQQPQLLAATNIVHLTLPNNVVDQAQNQVQSVIQPNQQSVIQTATNLQPLVGKANVILVSKPNSVIQTPQGSVHALQVVDAGGSDDSYSDDESPKKRRDLLTRRPSYRKILNDLGGGEIAEPKVEQTSSEGDSELSSHSIPYHAGQFVIPAGAIQISSGEGGQSIHTLTMTNSTTGSTIVQYAQGQEFFVPVVTPSGNISSGGGEDQARKREMRLLKNREAARECRRKKKEYIKCLENRVAVLENQNKALMDELKTLKELYCQQKTE